MATTETIQTTDQVQKPMRCWQISPWRQKRRSIVFKYKNHSYIMGDLRACN